MKKTTLLSLILFIFVIWTLPAFAIANRWDIQWTASPEGYVESLYVGVLGRPPENTQVVTDWARNVIDGKPESRLGIFWGFVMSSEYQSRPWAKFDKQWLVIQTRERTVRSGSKLPTDCNFYWVTKSPRHGQKVVGHTKQTYLVAQALVNYHTVFDQYACIRVVGIATRANPVAGRVPTPPAPVVAPGQGVNPILPVAPVNPGSSASDKALQQRADQEIAACAFNKADMTIGLIKTQSIRTNLSNKLARARKRESGVRKLYSEAKAINNSGRQYYSEGNTSKAADNYKSAQQKFKQALVRSQCQSVRKTIHQAIAAVQRNLDKATSRQADLKQQKNQLWETVKAATERWITFKCRNGFSGCAYEPPLVKDLLSYKVLGAATLQKLTTAQKIFSCTDRCIMADGSPRKCYSDCERQYER